VERLAARLKKEQTDLAPN